MTPGTIARHVDILAVGVVLLCYGAFTAVESGVERWRAFHGEGRSIIQRLEHRRQVAPVRIYLDSRRWLRRA